jgi:hypothetical protein
MKIGIVSLLGLILLGCASREAKPILIRYDKSTSTLKYLPPRPGHEVEDSDWPKWEGWDVAVKIKR